ncbi:MAG: peptidylprolyl isomerase [Acidobacteria bacterium]|nr:peptidylprolyl isomerase [Acidobacteriota bacterium]
MNKALLTFCISTLLFALSCGGSSNNAVTNSKNGEVKKGVVPVADAEIAVIEMETPAYGTVKLELYSNIAPQMVARFKELAKEGYYNGIAFHRINQTVIQAGDSNTKAGAVPKTPGREGDSGKPNVPAEFSDVPYNTGILGAARFGNDVNSANSQFFIMLKREAAFDNKYTVFGKVIEGMNNVMTISGVPKDGERPQEPVRIKNITIVAK